MLIYDPANNMYHELKPKKYTLQKKFNKMPPGLLVFRHSHIAITGYHLGDNWEFEKFLSVWDDIKHRYRRVAGWPVPELDEFRVPRSFSGGILQKYFPYHKPTVENDAYPSEKTDVRLLTPPRDDEQKVGISFLCAEGDFRQNRRYTTLMLDNSGGSGKSFTCAAACCFLKAKVCVFVPVEKVLRQWIKTFVDFTSYKEEDTLLVSGSDMCLDIIAGKYKDIKVFVFSTPTVVSFQKQYGNLETIELLRATGAYVKIIDEFHRNMRANNMIDALSNFHMNFYASATPTRSGEKEPKIFRALYRNCPRFGSNFKVQEEEWTNVLICMYKWTPTPAQQRRMINRQTKWLNARLYEKELINSPAEQRANFEEATISMFEWGKNHTSKGNKVLIMCATVDGTEYAKQLAERVFDGKISRYYGALKPKEKEEALTADVICATAQSLGVGADIKKIQQVFMLATYSNVIDAGQLPRRARKLDNGEPVYYTEMVNAGYVKTFNQYNARIPALTKTTRTGKLMLVQ